MLVVCHSKDILHRDIKPENIFLNDDGDYKLGDFGISRIMDACPGSTASTGIGTPEYAAPEQGKGKYDIRVDVYSLGLVLYELSNQNRLPFASSSYLSGNEVQMRMAGMPIPVLTNISADLYRIIDKACAFNPNDRFQTAQEMLDALKSLPINNLQEAGLTSNNTRMCLDVSLGTVPAMGLELSTPGCSYETIPALQANREEYAKPDHTNAVSDAELDVLVQEAINELEATQEKSALENFNACKTAAEGGGALAQYNLAGYYQRGTAVKKDIPKAISLYQKAASQGYLPAQYELGSCYQSLGNYDSAIEWYQKAAKKGETRAQRELGNCYLNGIGVSKDEAKAVFWYRQAAQKGYHSAQRKMAYFYETGTGVPKDNISAAAWYLKASKQGDAEALEKVQSLYLTPSGEKKEAAILIPWYEEEAKKGNLIAEYNLGVCYQFGIGVKKDIAKAMDYYLSAKTCGSTKAGAAYARILRSSSFFERLALKKSGHIKK